MRFKDRGARDQAGETMSDCTSREEYEAKFFSNQKLSGIGAETTCHVPCPFCAEPDFLVHRVLETEAAYTAGAVCKQCGRGAKAIFKNDRGGIQFTMVQTVGEDGPAWMPMPRETP